MSADLLETVNSALGALPGEEEIRRRIAENLQERLVLRRMLKLVEQRQQMASLFKPGGRRDA